MKLFNIFKNKEKPVPAPETPKKFTFDVMEAVKVGDRYQYTIEADTRHEALVKLVKYFFGEESYQEVKSQHFNVTYSGCSSFVTNMPYWLAKRISGYAKEGDRDYHKELQKFAIDNNIKLKE